MKHLVKSIVALSLVLMATHALDAQVANVSVTAAFAPNGRPTSGGSASPSWPGYVVNATNALRGDSIAVGDREINPAAYEAVITPISPLEMIYTDFNSWRSSAAPSSTWDQLPAAFDQEKGNRIHFGVQIATDGTTDFALHDLSWALDSTDETDYFDQIGSFAGANYSSTRIGINYGPDHLPGGGDDIIYDNGQDGALAVNELTYVGVGDGFFSQEPAPVTNNADIDATLRTLLEACVDCNFDFSATYTLDTGNGTQPVIGRDTIEIYIEPGFGSDFNRNFRLDSGDLDMLTRQIADGSTDILFDLDRVDENITFNDLQIAVKDKHYTYFGDANDNGVFDSSDLVSVFVAGLYDAGPTEAAVWSTGDWNGDGEFSSTDLVIAMQDGGYDQGPRPPQGAAVVVPEPSAGLLTLLGLVALIYSRRRSS